MSQLTMMKNVVIVPFLPPEGCQRFELLFFAVVSAWRSRQPI